MTESTTQARVLVITDLSADGDVAMKAAAQEAAASGAELCVVHTVPDLSSIRPLFPQRLAEESVLAAELPGHAEQALRARLAALDVDTTKAELVIERGTTVEGAMRAIDRWQPTLVVIGAADGAVDAVRLVRHLACPLLVARSSPDTRVVVAGTDLSDPSRPAIRAAAEACARLDGELVVAHAIEVHPLFVYGVALPPMFNPMSPGEIHEAAQQRLDQAVREAGATARTTIRVGPPSAALLELARAEQARLLVVATHGRTGLTRFVLGSVAENVIRQAPCSVLVVRAA